MNDNEFIRMRQEEGADRSASTREPRGFEWLFDRVRNLRGPRPAARRASSRARRA